MSSPDRPSTSDDRGGTGMPPYEPSPFTDWREQLRDRVKEIRARKLADKRRGSDPASGGDSGDRLAEAAREERLRAARSRAAAASGRGDGSAEAEDAPSTRRNGRAASADHDEETIGDAAREALASLRDTEPAEDALPATATAADEALGRGDESEAVSDESEVEDDELWLVAETNGETDAEAATAAGAAAGAGEAPDERIELRAEPPAPPTPPSSRAVPEFQADEPELAEDRATLPTDLFDTPAPRPGAAWWLEDDDSETAAAEPDPGDAFDAEIETAPPPDGEVPEFVLDEEADDPIGEMTLTPYEEPARTPTRPPSWWRPGDDPLDATLEVRAEPDLEAIPEDLRDKHIPSWAIPRRHSSAASAGAGADDPIAEGAATPRVGDEEEIDDLALAALDSIEPGEVDADDESAAPEADRETRPRTATPAAPSSGLLPWDQAGGVEDPQIPMVPPAATGVEPVWQPMASSAAPEPPAADPAEPPDAPHGLPAAEPEVDDDPLGDVYLVGEFATRGADGKASPRKPVDLDAVDPLAALRQAVDGKERRHRTVAGQPASAEPSLKRPIPNLYASGQESPVEKAPAPYPELEQPAVEAPAPNGQARERPASEERRAAPEPEAVDPEPAESAEPRWDIDADEESDDEVPAQHLDPSAPVSDRVFSALADGLVVAVLGLLLGIAGASAAGTGVIAFVRAAPVPFVAAWSLFAFAYGVFFVGTCGQTLGKMAMRVRVIGAERFEVGYPTAARRAMLYTLATLPVGLGLLPALRDREHRALHDRLSATRVVKA